MIETFVIVPTYNEADNLPDLLEQLLALPLSLGVIVVDDNSPDGTGQLADQWAEMHPDRVIVIHRSAKLGLGTAYLAGYKKALGELKAARVMTMDADFSHHPRYIPAMVAMSQTKHMVIGSRYVPGGGHRHWGWQRILLSGIANIVTRLLLGLNVHDTTAGFRLYRREVLAAIPLDQIKSNGYSFLVEMLFVCQRQGWQIGELPIVFEDRRKGQTKISRQEIWRAQMTVLRLFGRRLTGREPQRPPLKVVGTGEL